MDVFILGSTGLVGSHILENAEKSNKFKHISTISRHKPNITSDKVDPIIEEDTNKWYRLIEDLKGIKVFFSAFGTTRADAGSADNFVKIDYGVNYESAKAARKAGVETFVLISSIGANANSRFLYFKTKGKLENDIIDLKFPRTIILRPGMLLGKRDKSKGFLNDIGAGIFGYIHGTWFSPMFNPIYGEELGKIAVELTEKPFLESDAPKIEIISARELTGLAKKLK